LDRGQGNISTLSWNYKSYFFDQASIMNSIFLFLFFFTISCLIVYFLRSSEIGNWWIKIITKNPTYTYFFGPFESSTEAADHQMGYIQDLQKEGAEEVQVALTKDHPSELTIPGEV
jgi:hypothetical protein